MRPISFLPSLKRKWVIVFYHVVIWALIALMAVTESGVAKYDNVKIIFYVTIIVAGLLFPLFINSSPSGMTEIQMRRLTISLAISFMVLTIAFLASIFL